MFREIAHPTWEESCALWRRFEEIDTSLSEASDRTSLGEALHRLRKASKHNPFAAFRMAEVLEFGLFGQWPDHERALKLYLRAHRLGDTRATWRLVLDPPRPLNGRNPSLRVFRQAMFSSYWEDPGRGPDIVLDEGFVAEAEGRAESDPRVRRLLVRAFREARDPRALRWASESMDDPFSMFVTGEHMLRTAEALGPEDGRGIMEEAVRLLERSAPHEWRASMALAELLFCSNLRPQDDAGALDRLLEVASARGERRRRREAALPYLEYYAASLPGLEPETRILSTSGPGRSPGPSLMHDPMALRHEPVPEWMLLLRVTRTDSSGRTAYGALANRRGGFEDGTFAMIPRDPDDPEDETVPRFIYKPTGFRLLLFGEDSTGVLSMFEDMDEEELRRVLLRCVDSARATIGGLVR